MVRAVGCANVAGLSLLLCQASLHPKKEVSFVRQTKKRRAKETSGSQVYRPTHERAKELFRGNNQKRGNISKKDYACTDSLKNR